MKKTILTLFFHSNNMRILPTMLGFLALFVVINSLWPPAPATQSRVPPGTPYKWSHHALWPPLKSTRNLISQVNFKLAGGHNKVIDEGGPALLRHVAEAERASYDVLQCTIRWDYPRHPRRCGRSFHAPVTFFVTLRRLVDWVAKSWPGTETISGDDEGRRSDDKAQEAKYLELNDEIKQLRWMIS